MDSKSSYHKTENRYKFESFTERISSINVDVIRRGTRATDELNEDGDSYFVVGLAKWSDFNCTQDFVNFTREVSFNIRNFAQLVHHEADCLSLLKKHLKIRSSLAYLPLLDLVVQIARDLQKDMYPHFREFFLIIVDLLDTQDTELIEAAFQTLGYLLKFLWRYLVKDIEDVYSFYSVLLTSDRKEQIQRFAADSFA
ncbi:small subunit processome component 20 homolog isoform X2 [Apostichopus japonicus]|uniref:small subunit processome component 20 homolog isoform X2 n=1 Tax=Stichopus japonicus TaxID=307972 RepID=UPI003AB2CA07